ncbi:MAG: hypothetical protein KY475_04210 [Planctomycetes bacterium]|nr:hypothetical protein [Planctomycetota bacterium]
MLASPPRMRRTILGILAIISVLGGLLTLLMGPPGETYETYLMLGASGLRIGLVLGAFWLAYPQLTRIPWWFVQALLAGTLVIAVKPKVAIIVLPLLIALWIVRPRKGKRSIARKHGGKRQVKSR